MLYIETTDEFENKVLKNNKLVIVDFFAVWCGPCKMISPVVENISEEYGDVCDVFKIDTDKAQELKDRYNVMMVPTIIFFKNGEIVDTVVGGIPKSEFEERIEKFK